MPCLSGIVGFDVAGAGVALATPMANPSMSGVSDAGSSALKAHRETIQSELVFSMHIVFRWNA